MQEEKSQTELYRHYDKDGLLLYVGISLSALNRLSQHKTQSRWFIKIDTVKVTHYTSRKAALAAEKRAIKSEKPKYNKTYGTYRTVEPKQLVEKTRSDLLNRIVSIKPVYSLHDVSIIFDISLLSVHKMVSDGDIGYIDLPKGRVNGAKKQAITGWQLLEYIDHLHDKAEREHGRMGRRKPAAGDFVQNVTTVRKRRSTSSSN